MARPHCTNMAKVVIQELDWEIMAYPTYSTNPSALEETVSSLQPSTQQSLRTSFQTWLNGFFNSKPPDFFGYGTEKLDQRWQTVREKECQIKPFASLEKCYGIMHQPNSIRGFNAFAFQSTDISFHCIFFFV